MKTLLWQLIFTKLSLEHNVEKLINPISNCAYPGKLTTYKEEHFFEGPPDKSVYNYGISKRLYVQLGNSFFDENNFFISKCSNFQYVWAI